MKKYLLSIFFLLLLVACGGDDGPDTPSGGSEYLNVENLEIPGGNTTATLRIQASDNCNWTITKSDEWIRSISPQSGRGNQNVTITVTVNPSSLAARTAILTVANSSGTISRMVTLTQSANSEAQFSVTPTNIIADAVGSTVSFVITGEVRWSVRSNQSWATISDLSGEGDKTITVALTDNMSEEPRTADITISSSSMSETVTILQSAGTRPVLADLTPSAVSGISQDKATLSFSYTSMFPVTEYGICYSSENTAPTKDNSPYLSQTASSMEGSPSISMTGLTPGTTYYVRAYAINAVGIQYSNVLTFTTVSNIPGGNDNTLPDV